MFAINLKGALSPQYSGKVPVYEEPQSLGANMLKILLLRVLDPHALQLVDEVLLPCSDQVFCYSLRYHSPILVFLGLCAYLKLGMVY